MKKKILLLILLALAGLLTWYFFETRKKPKDETPDTRPAVGVKHSAEFNKSIDGLLVSYFNLSEALVKWDSATAKNTAVSLLKQLDNTNLEELKKDSLTHQSATGSKEKLRKNLAVIVNEADLTQKRHAFNSLSQNMSELLRGIQYSEPVYLQECTMAFNDTGTGIWLSKTPEIRNPYLGLHHPKYKKGMLACGETKGTLMSKSE